jgi:hypothetical protein
MTKRKTIATLIGTLVGIMFCAPAPWAQTTPDPATSPAPTVAAPKKPTSATPQMIDEAIQRSQARSAKAKANGAPEQWGSEEPFTYVPGKTF